MAGEKKLDVYRDWLKIEAPNRPLNYYQLLRLKAFEDDPAVIRDHYRKLNAYIRKFATGDYIDESQNLLNELARAMLCLTDQERKEEYDEGLGRKTERSVEVEGKRSLEDILVQDKIITSDQLKKAKNYANAVGLDLQLAVLQQKMAKPEDVMLAYAESEGLPFVNLDDIPVDEFYAPQINPNTARQHSFVPVMADMGKLILASPSPVSLDVEEELRQLFEMPVRCAICSPAQVNAAIAKYYPRDAVQRVVKRQEEAAPVKRAKKKNADDDAEPEVETKKSKKQTAPPRVLSEAAKKNRLKMTLVFFNFAFMAGAFFRFFTVRGAKPMEMIIPGLIAGAVGAIVGWVVGSRMKTEDDEDEGDEE